MALKKRFFYFLIFVGLNFFHLQRFQVDSAACDMRPGFVKADRIEFDENTPTNTLLFQLPFEGEPDEIEEIKLKSNELNEAKLSEYFRLEFTNLYLNSEYDLDLIQIDLIEMLITCVPKSLKSANRNTFLLYVTINDVNDNAPQFVGTPYRFTIKELIPIGTIVYQNIKAIDADLANKPNSQISYSIQKSSCSDFFEFPLTTKSDLASKKLIYYEILPGCNLTINAEDHGFPKLSSSTTIEIRIIDTDDKDPIFSSSSYTGSVPRNSLPGILLNMSQEEITAYDQDVGINATLKYSLRTNPNNLFEIDEDNGKLRLKQRILDYEKSEYNLIVKAHQIDNPQRSALATVNVLILDINENPPRFEHSVYDVKIRENSPIGQFLCQVKANDPDNNKLEYAIVNNHEWPFTIDKRDGRIKVNGRLDYEHQSKYALDIIAKDGNFSDTTQVKIELINIVDTAPYFEQNRYEFKLKIPSDIYIGQLRGVDLEKSGNLKYSLKFNEENRDDSSLFCISQNGIIYICPRKISLNNKNETELNEENVQRDGEFLSRFQRREYKFNASASVYSKDLSTSLENTVECRVLIDLSSDESNSSTTFFFGASLPFSPPSYLNEKFFKDKNNIYIIAGTFFVVVLFLIFSISGALWLKCGHNKNTKKRRRNSKNPYQNYDANSKQILPPIGYYSAKTNYCGSNCSDCNSCVNSTSSGTSCTLAESTKSCSSSKKQQQQKPQQSNDLNDHSSSTSASSPISKLTMISDYLNNESQMGKMSKRVEFDPIRVSTYSDILSSTASTLKNRDMPILIRQESVYDVDNYEEAENIQAEYFQIVHRPQTKETNNNKSSTFKTPNSYCIAPSKNQDLHSSPKLLSFQPPPAEAANIIYNYHEPLSANSETNYENDVVMRADRLSIYEELKSDKSKNETFRTHIDSCNNSLVKLVNLINSNQPLPSNSKSAGFLINASHTDSSMISASIDEEILTSSESLLSEVTLLPNSPTLDVSSDDASTLSMNVDSSTDSYSSSSPRIDALIKNRPFTVPNEYVYENYIRLDNFNEGESQFDSNGSNYASETLV